MASRVTYQNISPEVTRKWCHPMPKTEGDIMRQGFRVTEGLIFWYSHPRRHVIYVMWHFKIKTKSNKMEYTARMFFISFYNSAPLFTLLSNDDVDLEPDLIDMQNCMNICILQCLIACVFYESDLFFQTV